eukprot:scaffold85990_cov63-Phaeocystis_antarctica.AAC.3
MRTNEIFPSYSHIPLNFGLASTQPGWSPRIMTLLVEFSQRPEWISAALSAVNKRMPAPSAPPFWKPIPPIPMNRVPTRRKTKLFATDESLMMRLVPSRARSIWTVLSPFGVLVLPSTDIPSKGRSGFTLSAVRTTLKYRTSLLLPDRSRGISWPAPAIIALLTVPRFGLMGPVDGHGNAGASAPLSHLSLRWGCAEQARHFL